MPAKYLPLIADYEGRIEKAFLEGDVAEAIHLLDRLRELPNMPDFPPIVGPRLREVLVRFDALVSAERANSRAHFAQGQSSADPLGRD
ncbi:MAG TPA: hypothetical protein VM512_08450 [Burkholderiaceae bacterium]|jgi:hypothetical protein|nr:hypothetical protein [Burkholderiaceae bacterium]